MNGCPGSRGRRLLLTNAIRYTPGANRIEVYLLKENAQVKVGVKDYGMGTAPDKLNEVFSRFYRVDDKNPNVSGLGIGLDLSYEIVMRHHDEVWTESKVNEGVPSGLRYR